jgi:hypothetical protein
MDYTLIKEVNQTAQNPQERTWHQVEIWTDINHNANKLNDINHEMNV